MQKQEEERSTDWKSTIIAALGCGTVLIIGVKAMNKGYRVHAKVDGKEMTLEFDLDHNLVKQ